MYSACECTEDYRATYDALAIVEADLTSMTQSENHAHFLDRLQRGVGILKSHQRGMYIAVEICCRDDGGRGRERMCVVRPRNEYNNKK